MKTKFGQFFMVEIFSVIINQMSSSRIGRDSYFYSIAEDNKRISDDWNIFQNLFVAVIVIGIICVWFESSTEEVPESSENSTTNDVPRLSTTSVSRRSRNTIQINENTCETVSSPSVVDTTHLLIEESSTSRSILRSPNDKGDRACHTPSPNVRSLLRSRNMPGDNSEGRNSKTPNVRRNLRFCDPERSEEPPPLRRSLRLNPPNNELTKPSDPTQLNSSEVLYCTQWCQRHGRKRTRSRSRSRSSSSSRSCSCPRSRSRPRLRRRSSGNKRKQR